MSENSKEFTIFLTRFGVFKYLVMPFGFCNKLAFWQYPINNILFDFLYCFVQKYLDNILIYSKTLKSHYLYIHQVLEYLQKVRIQADIDKYKFYI